ncbi:MAG TPA: hypothetical protein DHV24_10565 [Candidatus Margulisbacteria bacterium]|nr:hypothetical protein [Candidatus Margulisiibacteriota bacterium]
MLHLDPQSRGEGCPGIFLFFHHHFGEVLAYPLVVGIGQLNACEIIDQSAVDQMMGLGYGHDVSPGNITAVIFPKKLITVKAGASNLERRVS